MKLRLKLNSFTMLILLAALGIPLAFATVELDRTGHLFLFTTAVVLAGAAFLGVRRVKELDEEILKGTTYVGSGAANLLAPLLLQGSLGNGIRILVAIPSEYARLGRSPDGSYIIIDAEHLLPLLQAVRTYVVPPAPATAVQPAPPAVKSTARGGGDGAAEESIARILGL
ncbi:MAG: hypothetical protein QXT28_09005 [Thermofilaceae archaeon]